MSSLPSSSGCGLTWEDKRGGNRAETVEVRSHALDSVSLIDPSRDEQMHKALDWLVDHQEADGSWRASYAKGKRVDNARTRETGLWVSLAICRVFTRLYE